MFLLPNPLWRARVEELCVYTQVSMLRGMCVCKEVREGELLFLNLVFKPWLVPCSSWPFVGVGILVSRVISVRRRGFEMSYLTCAHRLGISEGIGT